MLTDDLFTFPIVMVDGENEERKEKENNLYPGQQDEVEYDIIYGEAAYPYYDFIGFEDRWLPTQKSLQRALKKKFDACIVRFERAGQFLVPMSKEKFKETINLFAESKETVTDEPKTSNVTVIKFTPDMLVQLANKTIGDKDEKQGE